MKWFDFLHNNDYTIGITKYKIMNNTKETKRIQFTIEELKTLEFHLGNEIEAYHEMLEGFEKNEEWEDFHEWRPTYVALWNVYDKTFKNTDIIGKWRWWYKEKEEVQSK